MRKILLLTLLLFSFIGIAVGQSNNESLMVVKSFSELPNDMTARVEAPLKDQNGEVCAVIKIETTYTDFNFSVGMMGVTKVVQQKGEIWVYVPHSVNRLTLSHAQLGVLRDYFFPVPIKAATTYLLQLSTGKVVTQQVVEEDAGGQYFMVNYSPSDVDVDLYIDDQYNQTFSGGTAGMMLPYGRHSYRIEAPRYRNVAGVVTIGQERSDMQVSLVPSYGYLSVSSVPESGVDVYINNELVGTTPFKTKALDEGVYSLRTMSKHYAPLRREVSVEGGGATQELRLELLANFAEVTLGCSHSGAEVYVNDELMRGVVRLTPGIYKVEARKAGHRTEVRSVEVVAGRAQSVEFGALIAVLGKLNISSNPLGAEVFVDGVRLGSSPNIFSDVLVGEHTVELRKDGYESYKGTLTISEGKVTDYSATLSKAVVAAPVVRNLPKKEFTAATYVSMGSPTELIVPDGYTHIAERALKESKVTSVKLPNSVTTIGSSAFWDCDALTSIEIPNSVTTIGDLAFWNCDALTSIEIPYSVTSIEGDAFNACNKLTNIEFKGSEFSCSNGLVLNRERMEVISALRAVVDSAVSIPQGVTTIGDFAFSDCDALTSIEIPNSVTTIGSGAFRGCSALISIELPNSVTTIGSSAFWRCSALISIELPNSVTTIGVKAFDICKNLKTIKVAKKSPILKQLKKEYGGKVKTYK
ncbi:MAG: leucine-rich repeat protein [Rikenellaceae bacterium]